ncbi:MAG: 30S ribosomal protein S3 [Thermoprotei archaeon]|nr:MAG: 30S ribosomal protein S3 [Thermoprotei archaeon]RLE84546.1 MAG: 30S ribosomal protein S3 [Thermoprotei archaeon]
MSVKKTFINQGLRLMEINEYLSRRLSRAGYIDVQIFRTPVGTRVVIFAERPPMVIGKRGITIKEIAQILEREFELENPQIDVVQIQNPELNAKIMAYRIARALARGVKFRRAAFIALRRIMEAGAQGAEIVISGKLTSERARFEKFRAGVIIKSGRPREEFVDEAVLHVLLKPGVYGVKVRIMPPVRPPDKIEIRMPAEQQPLQVG